VQPKGRTEPGDPRPDHDDSSAHTPLSSGRSDAEQDTVPFTGTTSSRRSRRPEPP
jgi:hypothetical protein